MHCFLFLLQTTVPSPANAESLDSLKSLAQIVAILGGVAAIVVILLTRTWPWLKAKLDRRSIQRRIGAEAFTPANIEQSLRYYVTPFCQNIDPAGGEEPRAHLSVKQNLFEALDDALSRQTEYRYLILLADSGMGKTSALLSYYARHIRRLRRKARFHLAVIPLGIPNADELIGAVENKRDTVLFLDALDEDTLANVDHIVRVRDLLELTRDFSRVVITCRSQFFPKDEEIPRETGILKVGARKAGEGAEYIFHKLYLSPFTDEQVKRYLHRRYPIWRRGRRQSAFAMIKQIPSLVVRPMLLAHIDDLIRREREITSSWDLYSEMVEAWLTREEGLVNKENLRQFSELLAVDLYVNRQTRGGEFVPLKDLAGLAKGWGIPIDEWRLGSRSLLNRDAQGNYKFAHRSIMEYLCVKRFVQGDPALNDTEWTDQMNLFIHEMFEDNRVNVSLPIHFTDVAGWDSSQCVALVRAVWNAEARLGDKAYLSLSEVLIVLHDIMWRDSGGDEGSDKRGARFSTLLTMATVCVKLKELMFADGWCRQAFGLAHAIPDEIKIFDILGVVHAAMGRKRNAVEAYESALKLMEEIGSPDTARLKAQ
ncbi:MAG TPA: hypothetical protein VN687_19285, partial [Blastocatellia bacterium]|nr:hypothetical protein [Blastocatellia bacterium]